ncbi:bifunctional ornithine acetyltransferase/N-acetylglutamate synthase [Alteribacter natronophilus]|uniref:bifunctional ornithine acetyltransferase/N-acetylglutamate synthase n=1 Tax=Alteribacter natronophilus TaxID=2583810 RepID=UPI00110DF465|nr:bifunctional ornithine acetyltransferase/N-acetylglutamate synthase [Alteribacter natronophilus]TMW72496.1 bifunctional ornithine acetyltransferase/N-acetylglutamate synthase [Alteribacter natronophilus]
MKTAVNSGISVLHDGSVTSPAGYRAGGVHCGIRRKKLDLGWLFTETPAAAAGVYTTNRFRAAPLSVTRESIGYEQKLQAVLVNSGVANACTGNRGLEDARQMRRAFSEVLGIEEHLVAVGSTGVIGPLLPLENIKEGIKGYGEAANHISGRFETAIQTTDTCEKKAAVQFETGGRVITVGGAAKGSGMVHPDMATMLGFLTTDADICAEALQKALRETVNRTFNMITVDGDSSTNDMVLVMANGRAGNIQLHEEHPDWETFVSALEEVCMMLAKQIARDGEGATKLIETTVSGALTEEAARRAAKAVISSNLVKTAVFGADPNWGRIVCAAGYSGESVEPEKISVKLGDLPLVREGMPLPFDEAEGAEYLKQDTIRIFLDLGQGEAEATAWGCDLTYDYVKINASYRT